MIGGAEGKQAMKGYEPRQVRKEATVVIISCV
jgi:hypothetical protein